MTLANYTAPITSISINWIAHLTLSNITCSRIDLIQLSRLLNLGVLTIGANVKAPDFGLDDNIVRTWARSAAASDAFRELRVLNCRSQTYLTNRIFDYLDQFPVLGAFNVEMSSIGSGSQEASQRAGWRFENGKVLDEWLHQGGSNSKDWNSVVHACFKGAGVLIKSTFADQEVEAVNSLPVLHLALGGLPSPALVGGSGEGSLSSFQRMPRDTKSIEVNNAVKMPLESIASSSTLPRKKPTVRASKRQDLDHLLLGFET